MLTNGAVIDLSPAIRSMQHKNGLPNPAAVDSIYRTLRLRGWYGVGYAHGPRSIRLNPNHDLGSTNLSEAGSTSIR